MAKRGRVLIIDDYMPLREACASLLAREYEIVGVANGSANLMDMVSGSRPDVVVLDISLPEGNGLEIGARLKRGNPALKLVFFTAEESPEIAVEALRRGASAYIVKHGACSQLSVAIRLALMNKAYVSREIRSLVLHQLAEQKIAIAGLIPMTDAAFSLERSDIDA